MPTAPAPPPPADTLLQVLDRRARREPERPAFTFGGRRHTFGELHRRLHAVADRLRAGGVAPGDRVVLALANGPDFFAAFYGAQRAGAVPVPLFPASGAGRIAALAAACGARVAVVEEGREEPPGVEVVRVRQATGPAAGQAAGRAPAAAQDPAWPPVRADDLALIQYTSGSTGAPKGVMLRHRDLLTNVAQMTAGMEITGRDVFVSWLPVHHDMGLVLMTMVPFCVGAALHLLPSALSTVHPWLAAIAAHRGTFTAAPDFAWRLVLRAVRDPGRHDLSSLRVALNAAEPVRPETLRRFHAAFGLENVMVPGYGLAEATVGVSMQPPGTAPAVSGRGFVAVGRPFPGIALHVITAGGREAAVGEEGEIVVETPAHTVGYFGDTEATEALFWRPGCIRTGDLGVRDGDGELYVVGRLKNVILQAGRNLAPQEIEAAVEELDFVRRAAAVGIDRGRSEGEQAYVFAELRRAAPPPQEECDEMTVRVVEAVQARLGLRPGRVLLVPPRTIPRTANGKVRHGALRRAWLRGELEGRLLELEA